MPGTRTTDEDTPLVFSAANGNRVSISDPDAGEEPVRVTLGVDRGALTLNTTNGLTFETGDGTDDAEVTFAGRIADLNAALGGLTYEPAADHSGAAALTVTTDDRGNSGAGGARTDADTVSVTVSGVNDPPTFTMGTDQTVDEDSSPQTVGDWAADISAGPPDEAGQQVSFALSSDNKRLFSGQPKLSPEGTLTYTPAKNAQGTATVAVAISDRPSDGEAGGAPAALPRFRITVQGINDAPAATDNSYSTAEDLRSGCARPACSATTARWTGTGSKRR